MFKFYIALWKTQVGPKNTECIRGGGDFPHSEIIMINNNIFKVLNNFQSIFYIHILFRPPQLSRVGRKRIIFIEQRVWEGIKVYEIQQIAHLRSAQLLSIRARFQTCFMPWPFQCFPLCCRNWTRLRGRPERGNRPESCSSYQFAQRPHWSLNQENLYEFLCSIQRNGHIR